MAFSILNNQAAHLAPGAARIPASRPRKKQTGKRPSVDNVPSDGPTNQDMPPASRKCLLIWLIHKYTKRGALSNRPPSFRLSGEDTNGDYEYHGYLEHTKQYSLFFHNHFLLPTGAPQPQRLEPGSCLQCGTNVPAAALHERILRFDSLEIGICAGCYPEFLQLLEDAAAADGRPGVFTDAAAVVAGLRPSDLSVISSATLSIRSWCPTLPIGISGTWEWVDEDGDRR